MNNEEQILALLEQVDDRLNEIDRNQAVMEKKLEDTRVLGIMVDSNTIKVEKGFAVIERNISRMQKDITGLMESQTSLAADISGLKESQTSQAADISGLMEGQTSLVADMSGLKEGQADLKEEVAMLNRRVSTFDNGLQKVLEIVTRIEQEQGKKLQAIEDAQVVYEETHKRHEPRIIKLEKEVDRLDSEISAIRIAK